jgi:MATE family multidrug resistance protein
MHEAGDRRQATARELLALALPLILSNSFWTLQVTVDRVFLSHMSAEAVGAAMPTLLLIWTPLILLQNTANYATTFVAQYTGAGRPERVGPVVWQALYFAVVMGVVFMFAQPLSGPLVALAGHAPEVQVLEAAYFGPLCFSALPVLIVAAASSFFAGRGDSWTVLLINGTGLAVNAVLAYAWIFGHFGLPAWGMAGAGWATVGGSAASALLALVLMLRPRYQAQYRTWTGRAFDGALLWRLLRFGIPNGLQWTLDILAFSVFLILVGRLGPGELAATSVALTLNNVAFFPAMGLAQGVSILVGQRLGQDRPDLAERTTWIGFRIACVYMTAMALLYFFTPDLFLYLFEGDTRTPAGAALRPLVTVLLRFVAMYSLFDGMNLVFSFALRGAGDTRFVSVVCLVLSWPLMVVPTWAAWHYGWGLYWAWTFASIYIICLALIFWWRFRTGVWKTMRVIELSALALERDVRGSVSAGGSHKAPAAVPSAVAD